MQTGQKIKYICSQLHHHAPFTVAGALLGVGFMLLFRLLPLPERTSHLLFDIFHPGHVLLSAMATAAMFRLHKKKAHIIVVLIIGYVGSIGIATLSDCVIPYVGEVLLGFHTSAHSHEQADEQQGSISETVHKLDGDHVHQDEHKEKLHLGFIDKWWLVNPLAILGGLLACFRPWTKFPHAGHVLLSIWASLSHILMAMGTEVSFAQWVGVMVFLFLAVWLPCCVSDIVFPLLFVKPGKEWPQSKIV
jgi:hypothetical protein